jgi:hypothetical protein
MSVGCSKYNLNTYEITFLGHRVFLTEDEFNDFSKRFDNGLEMRFYCGNVEEFRVFRMKKLTEE